MPQPLGVFFPTDFNLLDAGCRILTLGQYLQPTRQHLKVERFIAPGEFDHWKETALKMGFSQVANGGHWCAVLVVQKSSIRPLLRRLLATMVSALNLFDQHPIPNIGCQNRSHVRPSPHRP